jgi:Domain of unknown function (DUF4384)
MRPFCIFFWICIFVVFGIFYPEIQQTPFAQQNIQSEKQNIYFQWAFGALKVKDSGHVLIPISKDTTLESGDKWKIFIELQNDCFVYLIHQSSHDSLAMLFPRNLQEFDKGHNILGENYIPPGNQWVDLDQHAGIETFYLLASDQRLDHLESLFSQYGSAQPIQKEELKQKILTEIKNLLWQHRDFKKHAERPVPIIGSLRGTGEVDRSDSFDVADLAIEISAQNFYSKVITIDHRK